jgi:hypothetical protein
MTFGVFRVVQSIRPGSTRFRRKSQEIIHSDRQAAGFEAWQDNLTGGAGVGGAFQDDQLTGA